MAAVALFMVGRLAKFNDIFTSTVPTINNFSNHALRINCLTLFVQLKIQNNILFLYTTEYPESIFQRLTIIRIVLLDNDIDLPFQVGVSGISYGQIDGAASLIINGRRKARIAEE